MQTNPYCYIFNPDHDLALADGSKHYMPPALITKMISDLAILPFWYADSGDFVLAASAHNWDYIKHNSELFGRTVNLLTTPEISQISLDFKPWGWNHSLIKRLMGCGADKTLLPCEVKIAEHALLSHRMQAVELLRKLRRKGDYCGESVCLKDIAQCRQFVTAHGHSVLKAPLSGSGKGLSWCRGEFTPLIEHWCEKLLNKQGCVIGEPKYDKLLDFAMEFYINQDGEIHFVGFSIFNTSSSGAYEGNILASQSQLRKRLSTYVPDADLTRLMSDITAELKSVYGQKYVGYLGVDMMICNSPLTSQILIHPCVEVNLRMNMGVVACKIYQNVISPQSSGSYNIHFFNDSEDARLFHQKMLAGYPLHIENNRVKSGYMSLNPVSKNTHYIAAILIE